MLDLFSLSLERNCLSALFRFPVKYPDVEAFIKEESFYNATHRAIFNTIIAAINNKETPNPVVIAARIRNIGIKFFEEDLDIDEYINTLSLSKPTEDGFITLFKELLSFKVKRDLYSLGADIQNAVNNSQDDSVESLVGTIDDLYARGVNDSIKVHSGPIDIIEGFKEFIEDRVENPPDPNAYMMGPFGSINNLLGSLHRPGNITCLGARSGVGKMMPHYVRIKTPTGWTTHGSVKVGDIVSCPDGTQSNVIGVFPQGRKDIYCVTVKNQGSVDCGLEHLWKVLVFDRELNCWVWRVTDTKELISRKANKEVIYLPRVFDVNGTVHRCPDWNSTEILRIEKINVQAECSCIMIDHPEHLYIVDNYIVTHNTSFSLFYNLHIAMKYKVPILWYDFGEMSIEELRLRMAATLTEGFVTLHDVEFGLWSKVPAKREAIKAAFKKIEGVKFLYEDISRMQPLEILNSARRFKFNRIGRDNPFLWVIDYLKPFDDYDGDAPEWKIMGQFIKDAKSFIKNELDVALFTSLQLNRAGISNGRNSTQVDDSENSFGISDRIIHQCSHGLLLRKKVRDEIERENNRYGNGLIKWVKTRHLGLLSQRASDQVEVKPNKYQQNHINFNTRNFFFEDRGDLVDQVADENNIVAIQDGEDNGDLPI